MPPCRMPGYPFRSEPRMKNRRSSSASAGVLDAGDWVCLGVLVGFAGGRYWLRQADRVVFELRVLEKRLSSPEDLIVLEGMESVTKESSFRRVDIQGMDWKGVGSLVAMLALSKLGKMRSLRDQ